MKKPNKKSTTDYRLKKLKFTDFFLGIALKNRMFLPCYNAKKSCENGPIVQFEQKV